MRWMILCALLVGVWSQDATKTEEKPAGDAAKMVNPVKPTPASLASGKKTFGMDCAMCHGKTGAGDGDLAADMKLTLKDYTNPDSLKGMTDGELFEVIVKGKGQMSGEEGRLKPAQVWDVVNFVRSLSKKS